MKGKDAVLWFSGIINWAIIFISFYALDYGSVNCAGGDYLEHHENFGEGKIY